MTLVSLVRAANRVELAHSDARLAKHQLELLERERDRLRTEATAAKAELSVARSDRERGKAELAEVQDWLATLENTAKLSAERLRFAEYTNKLET